MRVSWISEGTVGHWRIVRVYWAGLFGRVHAGFGKVLDGASGNGTLVVFGGL